MSERQPPLGVVIVNYKSSSDTIDCLSSLIGAAIEDKTKLDIVIVDNASGDRSIEDFDDWLHDRLGAQIMDDASMNFQTLKKGEVRDAVERDSISVRLVASPVNGGFAGGVNIGLKALFSNNELDRVWVLNPDSIVPVGSPAAFATYDAGDFSLMGGRVIYYETPDFIQIDGGTLNRSTGVTGNINLLGGLQSPMPSAGELDFITGASMVVSRKFYENVGPMREEYFLYYEEVDWAMRRGDLPLAVCPTAVIYHRGGTSIGSPTTSRPATPFSLYFKHRARLMFMKEHFPKERLMPWVYTLAKMGQYLLKGWGKEAEAVWRGATNSAPPKDVAARLSPEAAAIIARKR